MPNKGSHGYPDLSSIHGKMTFVCKIARKPEIRQDDFGLQADARKTRLLQNLRCEYKKRKSRNLMTHPSTRLDASLVFCFGTSLYSISIILLLESCCFLPLWEKRQCPSRRRMGTTTPFESASSSRVIPPPWRWRGWLFADLPRSPLDRWCWVPGVLAIIWPVEHEPNRGSSRRNPNRGVPETKPVLRVEFLVVSRTLVGFIWFWESLK